MNKILLALGILTAGTGGFIAAHSSTDQLRHELNAHHDAWLVQTQQLAAVQKELANLAGRIRRLKAALAQSPPVAQNELWATLSTNRADRLSAELCERVLEELGFNWQFSPDFIVVTKNALRASRGWMPKDGELFKGWMLKDGKLSEAAVAILALTAEERGRVEAALQQGQADFNEWALTHVARREPKDDVVADYALPGNRALWSGVSNNLALAVGRERANLILNVSREELASELGLSPGQNSLTIKRALVGNEQRLNAEIWTPGNVRIGYLPQVAFPAAFRPVFTNGWTDVAQREGFHLPPEQPQAK